MAEAQTCGRRMLEPGPWKREEGLDAWETDRWAATEEHGRREKAAYEAEHPGSTAANRWWRGPGPAPRTCSFCGGVNPEDAIALIRDHGWEVEATGKAYKRYLQPPGSRFRHATLLRKMRERRAAGLMGDAVTDAVNETPSVWSPVPPVKLYVQHFTPEQIEEFNEALRARGGSDA